MNRPKEVQDLFTTLSGVTRYEGYYNQMDAVAEYIEKLEKRVAALQQQVDFMTKRVEQHGW